MRERGNINGGDGVRVLSDVLSDPVVGATHPSFYRLKGGESDIRGCRDERDGEYTKKKRKRKRMKKGRVAHPAPRGSECPSSPCAWCCSESSPVLSYRR